MIQRKTHLGALALVEVVLIQRAGVAVVVGAEVTVGAEAGGYTVFSYINMDFAESVSVF